MLVAANERMNPEIKREWLEALRSNNYVQGRGQLRDADNSFCCLGVLCDLADRKGVVKSERATWQDWNGERLSDYFIYYSDQDGDRSLGGLPFAVQNWAGLVTSSGGYYSDLGTYETLADLNDLGATFEEIADVIEKHF